MIIFEKDPNSISYNLQWRNAAKWGPHLHIAITTYKNNWTIEMLKIAVQHLCTSPYVVMQRE